MVLAFSMVLINNCKKDENGSDSDKASLRISRIADNQLMANAEIFEYNSDGLLTKFAARNQQWGIKYNSAKQPIEVEYEGQTIFFLIWEANKCTTNYPDNSFKDVYILDNNNQIKKTFLISFNPSTNRNDTSYVQNFIWEGKSKLIINEAYIGGEATMFSFGSIRSPFTSINVVLVAELGIDAGAFRESQNLYATEKYVGRYSRLSSNSLTITYSQNEQNYPTKAEITFGNRHSYSFFEYEK